VSFEEKDNELGGLETEKIQKRVDQIKIRYVLSYLDLRKISITLASITSQCWNGLLRR
jgi:hypothetical protein